MKFLVAFLAVLGYASANLIAPLGYGLTAGDIQGAAIDARAAALDAGVAARDNAIAWTDATRQVNDNLLWNGVAANQAWGAGVAGVGIAAPWGIGAGVAPIAAAPWGVAGHGLVNGLGLGLGAW